MKPSDPCPAPASRNCTILGLILVLASAGCATPPSYPGRAATACPVRQTNQQVTVGAYPMFDRQELSHYFGKDLLSARLLPVLVVVENGTASASYLLSMKNCSLSHSTGLGGKENLSSREAEGFAATVLGGALLGTAVLADAGSKRTGMALKELRDQTVSPAQTEQGFVYFTLPAKPPATGSPVVVRIRLSRLGSEESLDFELPFNWER